jgi:hypothetical protein
MLEHRRVALALLIVAAGISSRVSAQGRPDPAVLTAAQVKAMTPLAFMDGTWKGSAWTLLPSGEKHTLTQTERIGPFLDGSVKVIEGRGYEADGRVSFNALAVLSFDVDKQAYNMRSYAQGRSGDFVFTPTADGFVWEIPAGPMTIRYTAVVKDGIWKEVGDRIVAGKDPVRFIELTLKRVGDTSWPAAGAVDPK